MAVQKIEEFVFSGFLGDRAMYEESSCSQKKKNHQVKLVLFMLREHYVKGIKPLLI
jgi:hypothetical protein